MELQVADFLPVVIQIGALAGAFWAIMRAITTVRSSVRADAEAEANTMRDVLENRQALQNFREYVEQEMKSLSQTSKFHHKESSEGRKVVYDRLTAIEKNMTRLDGDVRVLTARVNAHGVNGGGKHT